MDLQRQHALADGALAIRGVLRVRDAVIVDQLDGLEAVEVMDQVVALADDVILVPALVRVVAGVDQLFRIVDVADDFSAW